MLHWKRSIGFVLVLSTISFSGCRSSHANPAPSHAVSAAISAGKTFDARSVQQSRTPATPKHPPRDSALSVYNNPAYGVSFRYPRNYSLEEDDLDAGSALKTQQQLQAEQPGSILIATIEIPDDAYPNTTFVAGHLQFAVNPQATAETCRSFVAPPDSDWPGATDETIIQGIPFHWRDRGAITSDAVFASRDYAGFSNGTCYEFFLRVAATPAANSAVPIAPADLSKILRPLEKTVSSLQLHPAPAP
jgi:hypothetical protein